MPGLFDGMRISATGIRAFRILEEVVSQNVANAANKNYTRQQARLDTLGTINDGMHHYGQGVEVREILRIRDELLDSQLRGAQSSSSRYDTLLTWYSRLQGVYNEPSDDGVKQALRNFWVSWSQVANDSKSPEARGAAREASRNVALLIRDTYDKLDRFSTEVDQELITTVDEINNITAEIASLNDEIFGIEAGRKGNANDLRDRRDAALNRLAEYTEIRYTQDPNGMINVRIGGHPVVIEDRAEKLEVRPSNADASKLELVWDYGERFKKPNTGRIAGILDVRDSILPTYKQNLDTFANTLLTEVNKIYSNGVSQDPKVLLESRLGYEALGLKSSTSTLGLVKPGEYGSLHISFYDSKGKVVRSHGILVDSNDSLQDVADKLNAIRGLDAALISGPDIDGRLSIALDTLGGTNTLGEVSFAIENHQGGTDTSGILDLLGFSQTAKSANTGATIPMLTSRDLTELQTILEEPNLAQVMSKSLNLAGSFTINLFDIMTETSPKTNGHMLQQVRVDVASTDSINDIMAKINNLTADYGISIALNANQLELTSTAQTDANGNVVLAAGTNYMRMGFSNDYRYPDVTNDEPPASLQAASNQFLPNSKELVHLGDEIGLFAALQLNTLFMGKNASDIQLDTRMDKDSERINTGFHFAEGANRMAIALQELELHKVALGNQFTIGEHFDSIVAGVGTDVQRTQHLSENEAVLLEGFISERDRISGVNIDEELANMILFQRSYEANARMFSTFNQMAEEILRLV